MNPKRIKKMLELIEELWNKFPDQRLYQLLYNYTRLGTKVTQQKQMETDEGLVSISIPVEGVIKDPFHYEDDEILEDLEIIIKRLKRTKIEEE